MPQYTLFQIIRRRDESEAIHVISTLENVDITNEYGQNLLHESISSNKAQVCELLISKHIDLNHKDNEGRTPLFYSAVYSAINCAEMILKAGGDLSIADHNGNSPLMRAVHEAKGNYSMVELFKKFDADPHQKNLDGHSPASIAQLRGNEKLHELLVNG